MLQKWAVSSGGLFACAPPNSPIPAAPAQWPHSRMGCPHSLGAVLPGGAPGRSQGCAPKAGAGRREFLSSSLLAEFLPCTRFCAEGCHSQGSAPPPASSPPSPRHWGHPEPQEDTAGTQRRPESLWPSTTGERAGWHTQCPG